MWGMMTRIIAILVFAVAVVATTVTARPAGAATDISGTWNLNLNGVYGSQCVGGTLTQNGNQLTLGGCFFPPVTGTYDKGTGALTLFWSVNPLVCKINATVAQDGNSMSGTWACNSVYYDGTMTGVRKASPTATPPAVGGISLAPMPPPSGEAETDITLYAGAGGLAAALAIAGARRRFSRQR
jgi:hypothetical protein